MIYGIQTIGKKPSKNEWEQKFINTWSEGDKNGLLFFATEKERDIAFDKLLKQVHIKKMGNTGSFALDISNLNWLINDLIDQARKIEHINRNKITLLKQKLHIDSSQICRGAINHLSVEVDMQLQLLFAVDFKSVDPNHLALITMEEIKHVITRFGAIDDKAELPKEMARLVGHFLTHQQHIKATPDGNVQAGPQ